MAFWRFALAAAVMVVARASVAAAVTAAAAAAAAAVAVADTPSTWHFAFAPATGASSHATLVRPGDQYTDERRWGYEGAPSANGPALFSVKVPEGNYAVTVVLGDPQADSDTTVKAEQRRLMLESVKAKKGEIVRRTFVVNVRTPDIAGADRDVKLNERERNAPTWDDKLTLEFNGPHPAVREVEIKPAAPDVVTVYIAGDSTVTDQGGEPYAGWAQVLPRFFSDRVAVSNHAESGRALYSFRGERRLDKILSTIKAGDYLFIQFGHNDQKNKAPGSGPFTTYKADLEQYIKAARDKGATPVIVTPMYRRRFDSAGKLENSLGDFPAAGRKVAAEQKVALIDLHEMSGKVFQSLGEEGSKKAFLFVESGGKSIKDNSHFSAYGAYELARCVVEGIRQSDLPLKKDLAADVRPFDPSHPDDPASIKIPRSPSRTTSRPEGS